MDEYSKRIELKKAGYPDNFIDVNSWNIEQINKSYPYGILIPDYKLSKPLYEWLNNNLKETFSYGHSALMAMKYNLNMYNNGGVLFIFSNKSDAIQTKLTWC